MAEGGAHTHTHAHRHAHGHGHARKGATDYAGWDRFDVDAALQEVEEEGEREERVHKLERRRKGAETEAVRVGEQLQRSNAAKRTRARVQALKQTARESREAGAAGKGGDVEVEAWAEAAALASRGRRGRALRAAWRKDQEQQERHLEGTKMRKAREEMTGTGAQGDGEGEYEEEEEEETTEQKQLERVQKAMESGLAAQHMSFDVSEAFARAVQSALEELDAAAEWLEAEKEKSKEARAAARADSSAAVEDNEEPAMWNILEVCSAVAGLMVELRVQRARLANLTGQFAVATEQCKLALHADRHAHEAWLQRGVAFAALGLPTLARIHFKRAVEEILLQLGDETAASRMTEIALERAKETALRKAAEEKQEASGGSSQADEEREAKRGGGGTLPMTDKTLRDPLKRALWCVHFAELESDSYFDKSEAEVDATSLHPSPPLPPTSGSVSATATVSVADAFSRAQQAFEEGDVMYAEQFFASARRRYTAALEQLDTLGALTEQLRSSASIGATAQLSDARELQPKIDALRCCAETNIAGCLLAVQGTSVQEAVEHLDGALALCPDNPQALCRKAIALERLGRVADALECLRPIAGPDALAAATQAAAEGTSTDPEAQNALQSLPACLRRLVGRLGMAVVCDRMEGAPRTES